MDKQPFNGDQDTPESPDAGEHEGQRLRSECDRMRRERDTARQELDQLRDRYETHASAELRLLSANLSKEIKQDFMESVKRGLWAVAILASIATAGGLITLSDILRSRIEAAVEGKHKDIEELRKGIVDALVDVRVQATAALKEVEALKAETAKAFDRHVQQVAIESEKAISSVRGFDVQVTASVNAAGQPATGVSATIKSSTVQGPQSPAKNELWFGRLPAGVLGIAGAGFNQVGFETTESGESRGEFSYWFQRSFRDSKADRDGNGLISFDEAVQYAASHLKRQNPVIVGEDRNIALFATRGLSERERPKRTIHAVLVGINEYKGGGTNLEGPVADVRAFAKLLEDRTHLLATEVIVSALTNDKATLEAIKTSLNRVVDAANANDIVVFYFAGHRTQLPDVSVGGNGMLMALAPYNFKDGAFLLVPELVHILGRSKATQKIIIADV